MTGLLLAGNWAVWVQPDGPNTQLYYLGCHSVDGFSHSLGDTSLVSMPDNENPNSRVALDIYRVDSPDPVDSSIQFVTKKNADWLDQISCPVTFYINAVICGRKDNFENWERSFIFDKTFITDEGGNDFTAISPDDQNRTMQSVDISARTKHKIFVIGDSIPSDLLEISRIGLSIDFSSNRNCAYQSGNIAGEWQYGVVGLDGVGGAPTNVYYTNDFGDTWAATAVNPFAALEDASGVAVFLSAPATYRLFAARGTTDAGNPMEIAYSDDFGAAWTNVNVGAVNGQYAIGRGSPLYVHNQTNIWLVITGGYIYFSDDMGVTWTAQHSGTLTAQHLHAVHFANEFVGVAVGESNVILQTINGVDWTLLTAPAVEAGNDALAVYVFDRYRFWVGYDSGNVYFTNDGGITWTERTYPNSGVGAVQEINFYNDYVGYIISVTTGGTVGDMFRTVNGGWTWIEQDIPSGTGPLYDLFPCGSNEIIVVGDY